MSGATTRWLLAGLMCLALWPAVAHGQSAELLDTLARSDELYVAGRYREALPFAEEALRLSEREFGLEHPYTAAFLSNLAEVFQVLGRYDEAVPFCKRALAIWANPNADPDLEPMRLVRHGCDVGALGVFSRYPQ